MNGSDKRLPRGMRDLLPQAARRRQAVIARLVAIFEQYGFEPLETPALELAETLFGKYGPEAERLIYRAGLGDESQLALRYDLSVPLARVSATYPEIPRPFRRYQVGPVWRGERPQRGRYREFVQADLDIVGSASPLADAEIIIVVIRALEALGFPETLTRLNHRKLLAGLGHSAGVPADLQPAVLRAIDKLDRVGLEGVRLELAAVGLPGELLNRLRQAAGRWMRGQADRARLERDLQAVLPADASLATRQAVERFLDELVDQPRDAGEETEVEAKSQPLLARAVRRLRQAGWGMLPESVIDRLLALVGQSGAGSDPLVELGRTLQDPLSQQGIRELGQLLDALAAVGIPPNRYAVDLAMVRGLDYYTGTIFETVVTQPPIGSITGGGRYDGLVALFGRDLPAVGTSFGVDRLIDVMVELGISLAEANRPPADVLVARFDEPTTAAALRLAEHLRAAGLRAELFLETERLGEQIRYALRREIPAVAVVGPDEAASNQVTVRDLGRQSQVTVPFEQAAAAIRACLDRA